MTQEQKDKLLKYLCMALPYGVKVQYTSRTTKILDFDKILTGSDIEVLSSGEYSDRYKPYLRPMSSMTEEEKKEYQYITERWMYDADYSIADSIDWLLTHHFDFMGLIDEDLAIDKDTIKFEDDVITKEMA